MKLSTVLEISQQYVKLVIANPKLAKHEKILDCVVENIAGLPEDKIAKMITENLQKDKIKTRLVTLCLPRNLATVRNLHLPSKDKKEITQMIDLHIGRIVPYKKEEIVFGHQSLGIDEMGYSKEILAIVHADIARKQLKILDAAGLVVENIVLSSCAVLQWAALSCKNEINQSDIYLLIDFDYSFADFIIFNRDNLLFTRSIAFDAKDELMLEETLKSKFISEAKQSLVIFQTEEMKKKPVKIFVSGASNIVDISKVIESEFNIPVKIINPPYSQDLLKSKNRVIPSGVSLNGVAELALEESNKRILFVLPEMQIRKLLKEKTRELFILGVLLIYSVAAILGIFWGRTYSQEVYLNRLMERNKSIEEDVGDLIKQSKKIGFIRDFLNSRKLPLLLINELQRLVSKEISVSFVELDENNKVNLRGQGFQLSDVFKFISTLENSKYFKDVQTKATRTKRVKDKEVTDFEISFIMTLNK